MYRGVSENYTTLRIGNVIILLPMLLSDITFFKRRVVQLSRTPLYLIVKRILVKLLTYISLANAPADNSSF